MPKNESITISLIDLHNVVELINSKKPADTAVEITMVSDTLIAVRDTNGFMIGTVAKTIEA